MNDTEFNKIMYDLGTTYSGYAYVRRLLERGELGEFDNLDALVMTYVERRKEMEEKVMQLCDEFGKK